MIEETSASAEEINSMAKRNTDSARSANLAGRGGRQEPGAHNRAVDDCVQAMNHRRVQQQDRQDAAGDRQDRLPDQHPRAERSRRGRTRWRGRHGLRGRRRRGSQPRSTLRRSLGRDLRAHRAVARQLRCRPRQDGTPGRLRSQGQPGLRQHEGPRRRDQPQQRRAGRGIEQIGRAIQKMEQGTQKSAANAEESAAAAQQLNAQSEQLREVAGSLLGAMVGREQQHLGHWVPSCRRPQNAPLQRRPSVPFGPKRVLQSRARPCPRRALQQQTDDRRTSQSSSRLQLVFNRHLPHCS
jgi:methyl-accepting chemotaxis protein